MLLFILSALPLLLAPFAVRFFERRPRFLPGLDAFVLVSVGGIVLLHILPHIISQGGTNALIAVAIGLLLPFVIERRFHHSSRSFAWVAVPAVVALAIHGIVDGMAVAAGDLDLQNGRLLLLGVIFHRIPEGMAIWWFASRAMGVRGAVAVLAVPLVFSFLGFMLPQFNQTLFEGQSWTLIQAVLFGSLIHVLMHDALPGGAREKPSRFQTVSVIGAVPAFLLLVFLDHATHDCAFHGGAGHIHPADAFTALVGISAAPALLGMLIFGLFTILIHRRDNPQRHLSPLEAFHSTAKAALPWLLALIGLASVIAGPLELPLDSLLERDISIASWFAAGLLGLCSLYLLLRLGLRGFLAPVLRFHHPEHNHH